MFHHQGLLCGRWGEPCESRQLSHRCMYTHKLETLAKIWDGSWRKGLHQKAQFSTFWVSLSVNSPWVRLNWFPFFLGIPFYPNLYPHAFLGQMIEKCQMLSASWVFTFTRASKNGDVSSAQRLTISPLMTGNQFSLGKAVQWWSY